MHKCFNVHNLFYNKEKNFLCLRNNLINMRKLITKYKYIKLAHSLLSSPPIGQLPCYFTPLIYPKETTVGSPGSALTRR